MIRDKSKADSVLGEDIPVAVADFTDAETVRSALEGADQMFLLTANQPGQVEHERVLIDAAKAAGVKRIVKQSTIGAEIGSPVGFWDWQGRMEKHLRESGIPFVLIHSNYYMSNLVMMAEPVRMMGMVLAPVQGAEVAMVDPQDVAASVVALLSSEGHDGKMYELTGPEAVTFERVAEEISIAADRKIGFMAPPPEMARQGMIAGGLPEFLADNLIAMFAEMQKNVAARVTDDIQTLTGKAPRTLADFLAENKRAFES